MSPSGFESSRISSTPSQYTVVAGSIIAINGAGVPTNMTKGAPTLSAPRACSIISSWPISTKVILAQPEKAACDSAMSLMLPSENTSALSLPGTESVASNAASANRLRFSSSMVYTPCSSAKLLEISPPSTLPTGIWVPSTDTWSPTREPSKVSPSSHTSWDGN